MTVSTQAHLQEGALMSYKVRSQLLSPQLPTAGLGAKPAPGRYRLRQEVPFGGRVLKAAPNASPSRMPTSDVT